MKTMFVALMSHEIRTPLNAIEGFSRIVAETESSEERHEYLHIIESNNMRLLSLIDDILDISQMESGKISINMKPTDINEMGRELIDVFKFRCNENIKMIWEGEEKPTYMVTDKNRLMQILSNLIGNALRSTQQGSITFGYKIDGNSIRFHVTDTGTGIESKNLDNIFNPYVTGYEGHGGTGLGLSLCKIIVERFGGTIGVDSQIGVGSEFYFILPYKEGFASGNESSTFGNDENESEKKNATILVADDTDDNYELIRHILGKKYHLVHAKDGIEAIQFTEDTHPQLILMDIRMPNMNGLDATRVIHEVYPELPVLAVSAYAYSEDIKNAKDAGCIDFLPKPIRPNTLNAMVERYITNHKNNE